MFCFCCCCFCICFCLCFCFCCFSRILLIYIVFFCVSFLGSGTSSGGGGGSSSGTSLIVVVRGRRCALPRSPLPRQQNLHITATCRTCDENIKQPPFKFYASGVVLTLFSPERKKYYGFLLLIRQVLGSTLGSLGTVFGGCCFQYSFGCCKGGA